MAGEYQAEEILTMEGEDFDDCKEKLFKLYGTDYKIFDRKTQLKKWGPFGIFQKGYVEVKYTVRRKQEKPAIDVNNPEEVSRAKDELLRVLSGGKSKEEIQLAELNKKLDSLTTQIAAMPRTFGSDEEKNESIERISEMLFENEFTKEFANEIAARLKRDFSLEDLNDFSKVERQVVDWIGEAVEISAKTSHRPPHVIVVVGPTGVGKTTTIAKFATQNVLSKKEKKPKMCMITVDRTRVGAEEQLRTFGDMLDLEVLKAENATDLKEIFSGVKNNFDIIYIDTSGYSPNDSENIAKLKKTLSVDGLRADIHLAVAASTKASDLRNIIQNYELFGFDSVIVTKLDETTRFGNIVSVLHEKRKSISFITNGQQVAHSIKRASVIDFLIRLSGFSVDRIHIEDKFGE